MVDSPSDELPISQSPSFEDGESLTKPSRVRFGEVRVHEIPRLDKEELNVVWFNKKDFLEIRDKYMETVELIESQIPIDESSDEHCTRGLECHTLRGTLERLQCKRHTRRAVLELQEALSAKGIYDEEALAMASWNTSCDYVEAAVQIAAQDTQSIQKYLSEPMPKTTRRSRVGAKSLSWKRLLGRKKSSPAA